MDVSNLLVPFSVLSHYFTLVVLEDIPVSISCGSLPIVIPGVEIAVSTPVDEVRVTRQVDVVRGWAVKVNSMLVAEVPVASLHQEAGSQEATLVALGLPLVRELILKVEPQIKVRELHLVVVTPTSKSSSQLFERQDEVAVKLAERRVFRLLKDSCLGSIQVELDLSFLVISLVFQVLELWM